MARHGRTAALGAVCAALVLAACSGDPPPRPDATAHVEVGSLTEVELNGDGLAVLTFAAEENYEYLTYAVGGTASFAAGGDVEAGVEATWYSLPEPEAEIVVRGEPGTEVLVSLQTVDGRDVRLGESVSVELVVGDCATHWLSSAGVAEFVAVLTGDLDQLTHAQGYVESQTTPIGQRTDAGGNPLFTTNGADGFSYRVCNTSGGTARYELRTEEHLEPGETPSPLPAVDGQLDVAASVPAGGTRVHTVFVPAGYVATVFVAPRTDDFGVGVLAVAPDGLVADLPSDLPGETVYFDVHGDAPGGTTVTLVVTPAANSPPPPVGEYTVSVD